MGIVALAIATAWVLPTAQAGEGQIIILRKVPPRPAIRQAPPAPPLAVRTAPDIDVSAVHRIGRTVLSSVAGLAPLSDAEAASIVADTGLGRGGVVPASPLGRRVLDALAGNTRAAKGNGSGLAGIQGLGRTSPAPSLRAAGGAIQRATAGLGAAISGAVTDR